MRFRYLMFFRFDAIPPMPKLEGSLRVIRLVSFH